MSDSSSECSLYARRLGDLLASLPVDNAWGHIEDISRKLANALRNRNGPVDEHSALGRTLFPQTLTRLLIAAGEDDGSDDEVRSPAMYELLRIGANLCVDHDENRGHLLEAGFPQAVSNIIDRYIDSLPPPLTPEPAQLSLEQLNVIKTAIGVLLNSGLAYEPVRSELISLNTAHKLLHLTSAIYPVGSWAKLSSNSSVHMQSEYWRSRAVLVEWSWRTISNLKDNESQRPLFGADSLPFLIAPLEAFIPHSPKADNPLTIDPQLRQSLSATDIEFLQEVSELLESLSIDIEDVRMALAVGLKSKQSTTNSLLFKLLDYVENGDFPNHWSQEEESLVKDWQKIFQDCKAAIIKAIVETTGDEKVLHVMWDLDNDEGFVSKMVQWLRSYQQAPLSEGRDDLAICASLSLGNLIRQERHSVALLKPPISLASVLVSLASRERDLKVKHGVFALLRHLAQAVPNRSILGEAGVLQALVASEIFDRKSDVAEIVQMSAIGCSKHLCNNNIENSIILALPSNTSEVPSSGLSQILELVRRSDSVHVKSEGTRVLVNVIKSLFSSAGDPNESRRQLARSAVSTSLSAISLVDLLNRSKKFPVLINEAVLALLLLALQRDNDISIMDVLFTPLPPEASMQSSDLFSDASSPVSGPSTALDTIISVLRNEDNRYQAEIRLNTCNLLTQVGKGREAKTGATSELETERLKDNLKVVLSATANSSESLALSAASRSALEAWE